MRAGGDKRLVSCHAHVCVLSLPLTGFAEIIGKMKRIGSKYGRIRTAGYRIEGPRESP
jgi:hypothetical protein